MPSKTQTPTVDLQTSTENLRSLSSYLSQSPCPLLKFDSGRKPRRKIRKQDAEGSLSRGRASLRQLMDLRDAVSLLQLAVDGAVTTLESAVRPYILYNGINSLPNEVLVLIFEQVCDLGKTNIDTGDSRSSKFYKADFVNWRVPVQLSHVDRRFRSVALKCPGLWTSISYRYRRDMIQTFLKRSGKRAGLTILLDVQTPKSLLEDISAVSRRWKSVIILNRRGSLSLWPRDTFWPFNFSMHLPSVESITTVTVGLGLNLPDIFELGWNVPNLKFLSAHNCSPFSPLRGGTNVTLFDLSLHNSGAYCMSFDLIVAKLRRMSNLTHLSLSLKSTYIPTSNYPPVELSNLTSLSLELQLASGTELIAKKIVAKNVHTINVVLHPSDPSYTASLWNRGLHLGSQEVYPKVQEINYSVCAANGWQGSIPDNILHLLSKRETLERLVLDTPCSLRNPNFFEDPVGQFPIFRSISLKGCHASINYYLEKMLRRSSNAYSESNGARGLKSLEIIGCPDIDMAEVLKYISEDRLTVVS